MESNKENNTDMLQNKLNKLQQRLYEYSIYTTNLKTRYQRQFNEMRLEISQKNFQIQTMQNRIDDKDAQISRLKQSLEALFKDDDLKITEE